MLERGFKLLSFLSNTNRLRTPLEPTSPKVQLSFRLAFKVNMNSEPFGGSYITAFGGELQSLERTRH